MTLSRKNDTKEGLRVKALKGGKWLLFEWTPELRAAIDRGYSLWPRKSPTPIDRPILVAKGRRPFTGDGLWQGFAARLGHTSTARTQRVYRRKPAEAEPLR